MIDAEYSDRPWQRSYGEGIDAALPGMLAPHLGALLAASGRTHADRPAFTVSLPGGLEGTLTFAEVDAASLNFARYLRHVLQVPSGARVALQLPNCLAYPVCAFGVLRGGYVLVNLNPLATERETEHYLTDSGAEVYVGLDLILKGLEDAIRGSGVTYRIVTSIADFLVPSKRLLTKMMLRVVGRQATRLKGYVDLNEVLRQGSQTDALIEPRPDADDVAMLQYTGGTTGVSKGVMLSHRNLIANLTQLHAAHRLGPEACDCALTPIPMFHIFALANALLLYGAGAHNVVIPDPRPTRNLRGAFRNHSITWMVGVTPLYQSLLNESWFTARPPQQMRLAAAGGTSVPPSLSVRWNKQVGVFLCEGYGLTEASPCVTTNLVARDIRLGTVGIPVPGTEVRIVDEKLRDVPLGDTGEVLVRGPQVMVGYWQRPEETAQVLTPEGWLRTGDIGKVDKRGYLSITDRKKDLVLVSGFNVYPREVEEVLLSHPDVLEAAVVAVPDPQTGERPWAFVVLRAKARHRVHDPQLREHCRYLLTPYKVPSRFEFRSELPKTNVGKIARPRLREEARRLAASAPSATEAA